MVAVCEAINIPPIVIFPFGTLKKIGHPSKRWLINYLF